MPVEREVTLRRIGERTGASEEEIQESERMLEALRASHAEWSRPGDILFAWQVSEYLAERAVITASDGTVVLPTSRAAMGYASGHAALALARERKRRLEGVLAKVHAACRPLVWSTNGRADPSTHKFVRHLALRWARARGVPQSLAVAWVRQRISVALQRSNGTLLVAAGRRMMAPAEGEWADAEPVRGCGAWGQE